MFSSREGASMSGRRYSDDISEAMESRYGIRENTEVLVEEEGEKNYYGYGATSVLGFT